MVKNCLFVFCFVLLLSGCTTYNHKNPYNNINVLQYENSKAYEFKNSSSNKLIILMEGSGWTSVLGYKGGMKWNFVGVGSQIIQVLGDKYTIFIPEKWDWNSETGYWYNLDARINYTFENLKNCYLASIKKYLDENMYSSVVLVGVSEGALLLPIIYDQIKEICNVSGMVSWGFGGLSMYESYSILKSSPMVPENLKEQFKFYCDMYDTNNMDSFLSENFPLSFMGIRPFDYYENINIPILFIHGDLDINVPVESTIYIQENLIEKPFEYRYFYKMAHGPSNYIQTIDVRKRIAEWINDKEL